MKLSQSQFVQSAKKLLLSSLILGAAFQANAETYKHSLGETKIDAVPERVVVLGQGSLDLLDALNIDPIAMPQALLPDYLAKYKADTYTNSGSAKEPNFETIYTLKPDLIIGEGRQIDVYDELEEIAPTYMFVIDDQDYWATTQAHWRSVGKIFDKEAEVEKLIEQTNQNIAKLHQQAQEHPLKTLLIMNNGNKLALFGENSRFSVVFDEFGLTPAQAAPDVKPTGSHGNLISFEYIANAKPDAMLILDREQAIGRSSGNAKKLFTNPLVDTTPAAEANRVVFLDSNAWYLSAGGFQSTNKMIQDVAQLFQPES